MSHEQQLQMLWPVGRSIDRASLAVPEGYDLRPADEGSVAGFRALMARVELGTWDDDTLGAVRATVVPAGWMVVVHERTGAVVATGMAQHDPQAGADRVGHEVGWIAADPDHGGRGLGRAVTGR